MSNPVDNIVLGLDRALRTLTGAYSAQRPNPAADEAQIELDEPQRKHAAGLMRVNHTGEICAQALYEGQALTAQSDQARSALLQAASEERDHLAWCRTRLDELDAQPSLLAPVFYGASFAVGALTGLAGDKVSLGFVEATEDQVVAHLDRHLEQLPEADHKSRAILDQMRRDEAIHGEQALSHGGEAFPQPVKQVMALISNIMTRTTYRI
ncbi:MAG: 2-polyprenyl-3-methyl-6-methoxy-1,4-benzoquinone monooxygenase [bacterium]